MADDGTGAEVTQDVTLAETPDTESQQSPNPTTDEQASEEEEFDKERALETIRKQRAAEKELRKQLRELDELRQYKSEAEKAKLSEMERIQQEKAELQSRLDAQAKATQDTINRYEVQLHASRLGFANPDDAVKLLDWAAIESGEDGRPQNVESALKDLLDSRPYLKGQTSTGRTSSSPTNPATRQTAPGQRVYTPEQLADREFYLANKDDIDRAYREGRIRLA